MLHPKLGMLAVSPIVAVKEALPPEGGMRVPRSGPQKRLETDSSWKKYANCSGMDSALFFSESKEYIQRAKEVCMSCSVQRKCLEFAIINREQFGVWGGLSAKEIRHIRRQRAIDKSKIISEEEK